MTRTPAPARLAAERAGRWAERLAAWRLLLAGYRVVARNYRCPAGEIDLVVRRGRTLVFVEVKARATLADAAEAIQAYQQQRIRNAASAFLARHPRLAACDLRFDAVLVIPGRWPRHVADAWRDSASWTR
jgi:putative endonuclease